MIALFLDESGSFECKDHNDDYADLPDLIGGFICTDIKHEKSLQYLNNEIKNEFIKFGGENFYQKIHGKDRKGSIQNNMLRRVFHNDKYDRLTPFYIKRGELNKKVNSNVTDDNTASMLYYNMINKLIINVLLYYTKFVKYDHQDVHIFLPTRRVPVYKLSDKQIDDFNNFAVNKEENSIKLDIASSVLMNLNNELNNLTWFDKSINVLIHEHQIKYKITEYPYNELYQLADIVCNNAYFNIVDIPQEIVFAYDDIDESYRRIYKNYKSSDLYNYALEKYFFNKQFKFNHYSGFYKKYIDLIDQSKISDFSNIKQYVTKLETITDEKNYKRMRIKYLLDFLEPQIENLDDRYEYQILKLKYYYLKLKVYNHLGDFKSNVATYEKIKLIADKINSIEALELKININTLYAVTCSNGFNFEQALQIINDTILAEQELQKILEFNNELLFYNVNKKDKILNTKMGKLYSSQGQYRSFLNRADAIESFYKAIEYFGDDQKNKKQTISYLIHHIAESNKEISKKDRNYIEYYLGHGGFQERINYFLNLDENEMIKPIPSFKLFAFIKLYLKRLKKSIDEELLFKLSNKISDLNIDDLEHPWQLIFFNLGQYFKNKQKHSKELMCKGLNIANNSEHDVTIKLMSYLILINSEKNKNVVSKFIRYLDSDKVNNHIKNYFDLDILKDTTDTFVQIQAINSKYTYMFN